MPFLFFAPRKGHVVKSARPSRSMTFKQSFSKSRTFVDVCANGGASRVRQIVYLAKDARVVHWIQVPSHAVARSCSIYQPNKQNNIHFSDSRFDWQETSSTFWNLLEKILTGAGKANQIDHHPLSLTAKVLFKMHVCNNAFHCSIWRIEGLSRYVL